MGMKYFLLNADSLEFSEVVKKKHLTTHPACIRIAHGKVKTLYMQVRYGEFVMEKIVRQSMLYDFMVSCSQSIRRACTRMS